MVEDIRIADYQYPLPEERIALHPLPERDASKLLIWKNQEIQESHFRHLANFLPERALLIFNDTKVIHARILLQSPSGARIEVFCLEPLAPADIATAFAQKNSCTWKVFIGNNKRWKNPTLSLALPHNASLHITRLEALDNAWSVRFDWDGDLSFAELLEAVGKIPLPPYIHRDADAEDTLRYQTIFAQQKGSVAAPTAGLHFTEQVLKQLSIKGIEQLTLTLHVGAGTFKPVSSETIGQHSMHSERVFVSRSFVEKLQQALREKRPIIPVGTTSLRSLESLYWLALRGGDEVEQWTPYAPEVEPQVDVANLLDKLWQKPGDIRSFTTALMIAPGYRFRMAKGIITNFHQPQSTLLLLISALIGPQWREIYNYALAHDFRFLSYGDSCLLLPH